ncbi:uncharacterized protein LOC131950592 [Physella acuta]|uniref:uncharacterized protein LOC131950592 n=1 Tax=Physella acuta TaxID=109671 RepID=UPI0027DCE30D|nr:uncharacterized protein LOC131950592 [Physella acuta]
MGNILARLVLSKVDYVFEDSDDAIKKQRSLAGDFMAGKHDAELCTGGEADLRKHYKRYKKNPGYVNFIPVNDFNFDHLPSRCRDVIMLEAIKAYSALTVMIKVRFTSLERPKSAKCFAGNYPFYKNKGKEYLRTGTD